MKAVAVLGVAVLLFVAPSTASQVPDDKLIVPGQRIGKWTLKMTTDDLVRMNGDRNRRSGPPIERGRASDFVSTDFWWHHWDNLGLHAVTDGRDGPRILLLIVTSKEYKMAKGIAVHSERKDVEREYGKPTVVSVPAPDMLSLIYDKIGLGVDLDAIGVLQTIFIFRPGSAKQIFRL